MSDSIIRDEEGPVLARFSERPRFQQSTSQSLTRDHSKGQNPQGVARKTPSVESWSLSLPEMDEWDYSKPLTDTHESIDTSRLQNEFSAHTIYSPELKSYTSAQNSLPQVTKEHRNQRPTSAIESSIPPERLSTIYWNNSHVVPAEDLIRSRDAIDRLSQRDMLSIFEASDQQLGNAGDTIIEERFKNATSLPRNNRGSLLSFAPRSVERVNREAAREDLTQAAEAANQSVLQRVFFNEGPSMAPYSNLPEMDSLLPQDRSHKMVLGASLGAVVLASCAVFAAWGYSNAKDESPTAVSSYLDDRRGDTMQNTDLEKRDGSTGQESVLVRSRSGLALIGVASNDPIHTHEAKAKSEDKKPQQKDLNDKATKKQDALDPRLAKMGFGLSVNEGTSFQDNVKKPKSQHIATNDTLIKSPALKANNSKKAKPSVSQKLNRLASISDRTFSTKKTLDADIVRSFALDKPARVVIDLNTEKALDNYLGEHGALIEGVRQVRIAKRDAVTTRLVIELEGTKGPRQLKAKMNEGYLDVRW